MTDVECHSRGPEGARCQKIAGHHGLHMGMTPRGDWVEWIK